MGDRGVKAVSGPVIYHDSMVNIGDRARCRICDDILIAVADSDNPKVVRWVHESRRLRWYRMHVPAPYWDEQE